MGKEKKPSKKRKPRVHSQLDGFEVSINQFGELQSNLPIEKINNFLDENVDDKKLEDREEFKENKKKKKPKE
jgi:hypothetical protein